MDELMILSSELMKKNIQVFADAAFELKEPTNMDEIEVSTIPGTQVINKWNLKHMQRNFQKHKMI